MTDWETVQYMSDTAKAADELNKLSQPLGYAVTFSARGELGGDKTLNYKRFTVHRIDQPVASGPTFDAADDVRAYLDQLAQLPCWRLDLDGDSIDFDNKTRTITDRSSGESFSLAGWGLGVMGRANIAAGEQAGAYEGATHLSVRTDNPPTVGRWYKSDAG